VSSASTSSGVALSEEDYLAAERVSETKHEYLAGVVYAMAGASRAHNYICRNILSGLENRIGGGACEPVGSDQRLRIQRSGASFYYYPDVTVDCSGSKENEVTEPTVIFEVLSPESDRADRVEKLVNYQFIPSLRVYVLVDQFRHALTVFRRGEEEQWAMETPVGAASRLDLPEIGCSLPLAEIYKRVL
jgi:Uma2 family endonuclease